MKRFFRLESILSVPMLMVLLAMLLGPMLASVGPRLDGYFNPVMGLAEIDLVEFSGGSSTIVSAEAEKRRNCKWLRTEWYLGALNGSAAKVFARHRDKPQVRLTGVLRWDEIEIGLSWKQIQSNSYALVYHDCYNGWLWKTRSVFFNSAG